MNAQAPYIVVRTPAGNATRVAGMLLEACEAKRWDAVITNTRDEVVITARPLVLMEMGKLLEQAGAGR